MKTNMNPNSLSTYRELQAALGRQEWMIYEAVLFNPGKIRRELEEITGMRQTSISGRANALVDYGLLSDQHGGERCSVSGKPAGRLYIAKRFRGPAKAAA